jgi:hypothetical protein
VSSGGRYGRYTEKRARTIGEKRLRRGRQKLRDGTEGPRLSLEWPVIHVAGRACTVPGTAKLGGGRGEKMKRGRRREPTCQSLGRRPRKSPFKAAAVDASDV